MGKKNTDEAGEKKVVSKGGKPKHISSGKTKEQHLYQHIRVLVRKMQRNNEDASRPRIAMDMVALSALKKLVGETPIVKLAHELAERFPRRVPVFHAAASTPQEQAV